MTTEKYDRQLRLWGAHGQAALSSAKLLVIGTSVLAAETLKSLVLPGVGGFTLVDDVLVQLQDLGVNFFLRTKDVGKPRASRMLLHLLDLNSDVKGDALVQSPAQLLATPELARQLVTSHTAVLAFDMPFAQAAALCNLCVETTTPFIYATSRSLVGIVRIFVQEHCMVESKPDQSAPLLRIADPFPDLLLHAESINLEELSDSDHAHVPYIILLIKATQEFRRTHANALPTSAKDREEYRTLLNTWRRSDAEGNFDEALANSYKGFSASGLPPHLAPLFDEAVDRSDSHFWIVLRAIRDFHACSGQVPLPGDLPDMTASTERFVALQQVYQARAEGDFHAVMAGVYSLLLGESLGPSSPQSSTRPQTAPPTDFVRRFCKYASQCKVIQYRPISEEFQTADKTNKTSSVREAIEECIAEAEDEKLPAGSPIHVYIAFRALALAEGSNATPVISKFLQSSLEERRSLIRRYMTLLGTSVKADEDWQWDDAFVDIFASERCELHCTAAFLGGVVAQETTKIITTQFVPLVSTFLWNGFTSSSAVINA